MAEIKRQIYPDFPTNGIGRIQTPISRKNAIGNLTTSRDRPWGGILYPVAQQPDGSVQQQDKTK
jgi:hypothetical protein